MNPKFVRRLGAVATAAVLSSLSPIYAATLQEAVQNYNAGKFGPALHEFEELSTSSRGAQAVMAHYYMALCLQSMGQYERAKIEYAWVGTYGDPRMKTLAAAGGAQLGGIRTRTASNDSAPGHLPGAAETKAKVRRVLEFYTDW